MVEDWFRRGRPYSEKDERLIKDLLSGLAIEDLATGEEFASWAAAAGFRDVGLHDITAHAVPSMRRLRRLDSLLLRRQESGRPDLSDRSRPRLLTIFAQ